MEFQEIQLSKLHRQLNATQRVRTFLIFVAFLPDILDSSVK